MDSFGDFMVDFMKKQCAINTAEEELCLGKVISESPLIIQLNTSEMPLYEDDLIISKNLKEYDEPVLYTTNVSGIHSHTISYIHHYSKLTKGTNVILYGINPSEAKYASKSTYQQHIVLGIY